MSRDEGRKIKPGITIDKEVWEKFKEKYPNSSQAVQNMMQQALDVDELPKSFTSEGVASITFSNPENWSMSWGGDNVKLSNVSYSSNDIASQVTNQDFDWKNIKIE